MDSSAACSTLPSRSAILCLSCAAAVACPSYPAITCSSCPPSPLFASIFVISRIQPRSPSPTPVASPISPPVAPPSPLISFSYIPTGNFRPHLSLLLHPQPYSFVPIGCFSFASNLVLHHLRPHWSLSHSLATGFLRARSSLVTGSLAVVLWEG
ncbi:uncharacterized protein SCHCODRAFT_02355293 [Schizophyllum commune H4-8]|uniref:uncharacterized protein n=1 Tax=Schizophyllum commune (strain H4-8 / FGSC 9210) TaxID=578458 RepID=UPI00215FE55F|nr:uncharacterized protein SCHCODRAFT_02355293 [Schizophyllum commune H4-8]KAI5888911.1 hypothetical protein SCHCODRAFT_02355293 [Schizophyllum commune H4-8]